MALARMVGVGAAVHAGAPRSAPMLSVCGWFSGWPNAAEPDHTCHGAGH